MDTPKTIKIVRSENIGKMHSERPNIGDEHDYHGIPCWVIDLNEEGAWFGLKKGMRRIDRHKGAFRKFGDADYPKKK